MEGGVTNGSKTYGYALGAWWWGKRTIQHQDILGLSRHWDWKWLFLLCFHRLAQVGCQSEHSPCHHWHQLLSRILIQDLKREEKKKKDRNKQEKKTKKEVSVISWAIKAINIVSRSCFIYVFKRNSLIEHYLKQIKISSVRWNTSRKKYIEHVLIEQTISLLVFISTNYRQNDS